MSADIITQIAQENIAGQKLAEDFLLAVDTGNFVDPDKILLTIQSIENDVALRGFCRALQKRLEQGAPC